MAAARNKSKGPVKERDVMDFRLMMKMSGNACTSKTVNCAPVINFENSELAFDTVMGAL